MDKNDAKKNKPSKATSKKEKANKALTRNVRTSRERLPNLKSEKSKKAVKKKTIKKTVKKVISKKTISAKTSPQAKAENKKKKSILKIAPKKAQKAPVKTPKKKAAKKVIKQQSETAKKTAFNLTTDSKGRHKLNGKFISKKEFERLSKSKNKKRTQEALKKDFQYIVQEGNVFSYSVNSIINNPAYTDLTISVKDFFGEETKTTSKVFATSTNADILANAWEAINEMRENEEEVNSPEFSPLITEKVQNTKNEKGKINRVLIIDYSDRGAINGVNRNQFLTYYKALL